MSSITKATSAKSRRFYRQSERAILYDLRIARNSDIVAAVPQDSIRPIDEHRRAQWAE